MEQRIAKLERQCRWYRNLFILVGLLAVAQLSWGAYVAVVDASRVHADIIKAGLIQILNNEGQPVIRLGEASQMCAKEASARFPPDSGIYGQGVTLPVASMRQ